MRDNAKSNACRHESKKSKQLFDEKQTIHAFPLTILRDFMIVILMRPHRTFQDLRSVFYAHHTARIPS